GAAGISLPAVDDKGDGEENLLHQVVGVGRLHPPAARQALDYGPVYLRKLKPGLVIGLILQTNEQARSSFRRRAHFHLDAATGTIPFLYTLRPGISDTADENEKNPNPEKTSSSLAFPRSGREWLSRRSASRLRGSRARVSTFNSVVCIRRPAGPHPQGRIRGLTPPFAEMVFLLAVLSSAP